VARRGIKKARKGFSKINPNLLIGGAIVGVVAIGGVLIWRALDPRQIPDKIKEAFWDPIVAKAKETVNNPYYTVDEQGNAKPNWFGILMTSVSPGIGLMSLEAKLHQKKKDVEDKKKNQGFITPEYIPTGDPADPWGKV
jgi:hypothetical protein